MSLLFLPSIANALASYVVHVPERMPALLTLIYLGGLLLIVLLLLISLVPESPPRSAPSPLQFPQICRRKSDDGSVRPPPIAACARLRWIFVLLSLAVFGFTSTGPTTHRRATKSFRSLSYKDLRNRRLSESTLRGWMLDRSGKLENALALYRRDSSGNIYREYPMDKAMAHIFGSDRGDPGTGARAVWRSKRRPAGGARSRQR